MDLMCEEYTLELMGDATGIAPADIELIPREGTITGRDGRSWLHDQPGNIINAFTQGGVALPIDLEHATQHKAPKGDPAPAVGWIEKLTMSPYGAIWGAIQWTKQGRELIEAKVYRYISPVFAYETNSKRIVKLISAGLTNKPNLFIHALNREESIAILQVTPKLALNAQELKICQMLNVDPDDFLKTKEAEKRQSALNIEELEICRMLNVDPDYFLKTKTADIAENRRLLS